MPSLSNYERGRNCHCMEGAPGRVSYRNSRLDFMSNGFPGWLPLKLPLFVFKILSEVYLAYRRVSNPKVHILILQKKYIMQVQLF